MLGFYIIAAFLFLLIVYLVIDYQGPKTIALKADHAFDLKCRRAQELIVQESDKDGNLWASRGLK